jgi:hypothetical protein
VDVIKKIEFSARNLTSNAGLLLLLDRARRNGIFDLIGRDLVFDTRATNRFKMNHIKTFRLKYIFLAGRIARTARSVVMKLSGKYPYRKIYEQSLFGKKASSFVPACLSI